MHSSFGGRLQSQMVSLLLLKCRRHPWARNSSHGRGVLSEGALRQSSLLCLFCSKIFNCAFQLCKCFIGSSLLKAAQWLEIHILEVENPPARDPQLLAHPLGHLAPWGLRNAFTFSQYYSLTIKIKMYFVLGFVTILALFILNTSGNTGMDCWDPELHFWLNSPEVSFFHLSRSLELCTHILLL